MLFKLSRRGNPISYSRRQLVPCPVFILFLLLVVLYQSKSQTSDLFSNGNVESTSDSTNTRGTDPSHSFVQEIDDVENLLGIEDHKASKGNLLPPRDLADIGDYNLRISKGHGLLCSLKFPGPDPRLQSPWTTVNEMKGMGYDELYIKAAPLYAQSTGMDQFLAEADVPISAGNIEFWGYIHDKAWYPTGASGVKDSTGGFFQNQMDWVDGVIIADYNMSPAYADPDSQYFPPIGQWSEVVAISWITRAPSPAAARGLKRVVRARVANHDTKAQIQRAFVASRLSTVLVWPGHRFEINPFTFNDPSTGLAAEPFMAMLGSKNGAGVAYLLLQHRAAMGNKCINAIRVWAENDWPTSGVTTVENLEELVVNMSFEIVDTPTGP